MNPTPSASRGVRFPTPALSTLLQSVTRGQDPDAAYRDQEAYCAARGHDCRPLRRSACARSDGRAKPAGLLTRAPWVRLAQVAGTGCSNEPAS